MRIHRSLIDRFFDSSRWGVGRQLAVATVVIALAAVAIGATRSSGDSASTESTESKGRTLVEVASAPRASDTILDTIIPTVPTGQAARTTSPLTAASDGEIVVLDLLATIPVELEHRGGYSRDLFAVWSDLDGDGCDTRAEVLIEETLTPAQLDSVGCTVVAGDWLSSYDGLTLTSASDIEIDHVVSLKEAWDSGAWQWPVERRIAYANDLTHARTLAAVSSTSNQEKSGSGPRGGIIENGDDRDCYTPRAAKR